MPIEDKHLNKQIDEIEMEEFSKCYFEAAKAMFAKFHSLEKNETAFVPTVTEFHNGEKEEKQFIITRIK